LNRHNLVSFWAGEYKAPRDLVPPPVLAYFFMDCALPGMASQFGAFEDYAHPLLFENTGEGSYRWTRCSQEADQPAPRSVTMMEPTNEYDSQQGSRDHILAAMSARQQM